MLIRGFVVGTKKTSIIQYEIFFTKKLRNIYSMRSPRDFFSLLKIKQDGRWFNAARVVWCAGYLHLGQPPDHFLEGAVQETH